MTQHLSALNKYLYKYRFRLSLGVIFIIFSNFFAVIPAKIIRIAFDLINEDIAVYRLFKGFDSQALVFNLLEKMMFFFGMMVISAAVIRGVFLFFMRQTIIVVSRFIEYDLKNDIFKHYQELSLSFYRRNNTGDLMNRISEDVSRVRMYLGPALMYSSNTVMLFIMIIITMFSINWELTFFALLPMPVMVFLIYRINSIIHKKGEEIQAQLSTVTTFVQETFSGIRVIKSFNRENKIRADFDEKNKEYKYKVLDLVKIQAVFHPIVFFLAGCSLTITIYVGGLMVSEGKVSAGNIAEFIVYISQLTIPMMLLGWVTTITQRGSASQKRINELMNSTSELLDGVEDLKNIKGTLQFDNVSFAYPDAPETPILKNISFTAERGKITAFVGKTGSGKTTLMNLISRMYDCTEGVIRIDGVNIKNYKMSSLRRHISTVPQHVFLFSDTIRNNITTGDPSISNEEVVTAAKKAEVYDNIQALPNGFDTKIGERGTTLSGGQKQRISIARALAVQAADLLILDDSLSAVDTKTEEAILQNISENTHQQTNIIVSHRISSIKNAHQIIVIDNGQIAEQGTHQSLLAQKGLYFSLYEKQKLSEN